MSADGSRIAIDACSNDGNGIDSGHVRIFEIQGDDTWIQLGDDIDGEEQGDDFGFSVAMFVDDSRIAIGALSNDGNGIDSGHVRIFEIQGGKTWMQLGDDIDGEEKGDNSGFSVAMSADGSRIVIGAYYNDGQYGSRSGHVRIYDYGDHSTAPGSTRMLGRNSIRHLDQRRSAKEAQFTIGFKIGKGTSEGNKMTSESRSIATVKTSVIASVAVVAVVILSIS